MVFAHGETAIRLFSRPIFDCEHSPTTLSYAPFSLIPIRIVIPVLICLDSVTRRHRRRRPRYSGAMVPSLAHVNQLAMIFKRPSENIGIGRHLFLGRCVDPFQ